MKRRQGKPLEFLFFIYLNFWYVPLFCFLLGLKICLLHLLVESLVGQTGESLSTTTNPQGLVKIKEWETLKNLENAPITPTALNRTGNSSIWLIYNRVPRAGGKNFVRLLQHLGTTNGFSHQEHEYRTPWPRFLLDLEQENLVTWFEYQHLPKSYDRHFLFVNFTRFQKYVKESPIYMNMVRDPIDRVKSYFLAKRTVRNEDGLFVGDEEWKGKSFENCVLQGDSECSYEPNAKDFTLAVPFFCGHFNYCVNIGDRRAVARAKFTIENIYSVVGVVERFEESLKAFEEYVPRFFHGATQLYKTMKNEKQIEESELKVKTSAEVRAVLESKLSGEVELFQFINQRLDAQLEAIGNKYAK